MTPTLADNGLAAGAKPALFRGHVATPRSETTPPPDAPYRTPLEHLDDELSCLAQRVALHAYAQGPRASAGPLDAFKGLVISEEEVSGLLRDLAGAPHGQPPDAASKAAADSLARGADRVRERRAASEREHTWLPLARLSRLFRLSRFEELCLIAAIAPEIDLRYEKLYGYLQDDVTRRKPSVGFLLDLFCDGAESAAAARALFGPHTPLFKHRLCALADAAGGSSLARLVTVDRRIVDFLLGHDNVDGGVADLAQVVPPAAGNNSIFVDERLCTQLCDYIDARFGPDGKGQAVLVHLSGPPDCGARALAESVCERLGVALVVANLERLPETAEPFEEAVHRIAREAALQPAALYFEGADGVTGDVAGSRRLAALLDATATLSTITFLAGRHPWRPARPAEGVAFAAIALARTGGRESAGLWRRYLDRDAAAVDVAAEELAGRFRIGTSGIADAITAARHLASWRSPRDPRVTAGDLNAVCRELTAPRLGTLARKIEPGESWIDLVLPPEPLEQLRDICRHATYRDVVLGDWGFERKLPLGKGISALFSGPPGTGKTMAARVIAAELQLDLYQIDLSQIVSKYIGETEKNLSRVFEEADASQAILFFDEADALFGKRSEVKDAHDRYANIEVGYLLQRMEAHDGIAILATNMRQSLDEAFVRRLRFIVEFPFPDEAQRRSIWAVTFPREAPLAQDVDLDLLAGEVKLAGGGIKNVALAAAFAAAAERSDITMAHLIAAARREHLKLGRTWAGPRAAS